MDPAETLSLVRLLVLQERKKKVIIHKMY